MRCFWFGVVLLALCLVRDAIGDYSESMLPSKEIRNRVQRTMRVNMRVGKRYGDSDMDDEEIVITPKRRIRPFVRVGKRVYNDPNLHETDYTETHPSHTVILDNDEPLTVEKGQLVFRPIKRSFGNLKQAALYGDMHPDYHLPESKKRLRKVMRIGKRNIDTNNTQFKTPQAPYDSDVNTEIFRGFKRSAPQFLLNPRVGKNDKTWKIDNFEHLHKRSDPKATDLWFGPRIGRSNDERYDDIPWSFVMANNGNKLSDLGPFKSSEFEEQDEESTD